MFYTSSNISSSLTVHHLFFYSNRYKFLSTSTKPIASSFNHFFSSFTPVSGRVEIKGSRATHDKGSLVATLVEMMAVGMCVESVEPVSADC